MQIWKLTHYTFVYITKLNQLIVHYSRMMKLISLYVKKLHSINLSLHLINAPKIDECYRLSLKTDQGVDHWSTSGSSL